jgi:hypothetical protein
MWKKMPASVSAAGCHVLNPVGDDIENLPFFEAGFVTACDYHVGLQISV